MTKPQTVVTIPENHWNNNQMYHGPSIDGSITLITMNLQKLSNLNHLHRCLLLVLAWGISKWQLSLSLAPVLKKAKTSHINATTKLYLLRQLCYNWIVFIIIVKFYGYSEFKVTCGESCISMAWNYTISVAS